jgi:hypothetical protein
MTKFMRAGTLVLFAVAVCTFGGTALAREKLTVAQGTGICYNWCATHRTGNDVFYCKRGCDAYWQCNGSDANATACRVARAP